MAVVGDEVMLCKHDNDMTYNRELEYVKRIVHEDMGQIVSLSSDGHGNLYVTKRH